MTVSMKKWGNSLAVRIPKDIAQSLSLDIDSMLELKIKDGMLVLEPKKDGHLETLVAQINNENLHHEVDSSVSVGNEEW